jgi:hypothetical protein
MQTHPRSLDHNGRKMVRGSRGSPRLRSSYCHDDTSKMPESGDCCMTASWNQLVRGCNDTIGLQWRRLARLASSC